jgi:imidazolonepropionase-like amidohydrolase
MLNSWLFSRLALLSVLFTGLTDYNSAQNAEQKQISALTAIRAARLLDVAEGKIISDAVVIVEGDKITAAGSKLPIPANAKTIDLGDATILPGLIDAHTHITYHFDENGQFGVKNDRSAAESLKYAEENARRTLEAGFTTIRNLGAIWKVDLSLRERINRGEAIGPRMLVSGVPLTSYDLQSFMRPAARLEMIRAFVRARIAEGADVIKIFEGVDYRGNPIFSAAEIRAAVEEASLSKLKVAVHVHEAAAVKAAVEGGAASIEHGTFLDAEAIRLMVKNHVALVPTLYLPTHYLERKRQFAFDNSTWIFFEEMKASNIVSARKAAKAGVWIVAGSDAVAGLHGNNAKEIIWLTKANLKPAEAIRSATLEAAKLLGLETQIGEIKAGKFADIIAVSGNPLDDVSNLERVNFVMKAGVVVKK